MRILIADDDPVYQKLVHQALTLAGYDVVSVSDGVAALAVLQEPNPPRIAILDWMMPGMDGTEVCRRIRAQNDRYVYLILLTTHKDAAKVAAGIDSGADDYIRKPFHRDELYARLRSGIRILDLEERLRMQATRDPLTGVLNRSAILENLGKELARAQRENSNLTIALVDIDNFKSINDSYGHFAGDAVLAATTTKMQAAIRPYDLVGRYGGEEFVLLLPNCTALEAGPVLERLRSSVCSEPMTIGGHEIVVTVSIGGVVSAGSTDHALLLHAADTALYLAKRNGRNRLEWNSGRPCNP